MVIKYAYDKERICDNKCSAFLSNEKIRNSVYYFETSQANPQYNQVFNILLEGDFCK